MPPAARSARAPDGGPSRRLRAARPRRPTADGRRTPAALAAAGAPAENLELDWPTPAGVRSVVASAGTLQLPDGERVIAVTFEDVTALEQARRRPTRSRRSAPCSPARSTSTRRSSASRSSRCRASRDWCFVELVRADGSIERAAIAAEDPDLLAMAREYDRRYPLDPDSPVGLAAGNPDGRGRLMPEIPDAMLEAVAQDAEHLKILRRLGFHSSMLVPMRAGGRVIGDIALVTAGSRRRYGPEDLAAAQELADRCALYLENARLYRELRLARDELEAILAGIPDAVTVQGPDGGLVYVNDAAVRLLGHATRESLLAADPRSLVPSELRDEEGRRSRSNGSPAGWRSRARSPPPLIIRWQPAPGPGRAGRASRRGRCAAATVRARGQRHRGHHRAEGAEATQRLLAEAGPRARRLARLRGDAAARRPPRGARLADWCMVDLVEGTACGASRSRMPTPRTRRSPRR